ncbi:MAG: MotA/TolQ/ExbB proton channel family protein [Planctomycetes bacterium]|nr:MotA/TolQ/ExbB proton channel family protein [Planctomycetota bacterium]
MLVLLATSLAAGQPTEDAAAPAPRPPQGFFEILFSGGPIGVVIMIALIGVSLTAAYLVFEQFLTLRRKELVPDGLADETRALVAAGQLAQADAKCRERPSLLSFVLLYGIGEADGGWSAVEKGLEDALAEQSARLFRRVEYLSVIGGIAPMLGLLGTVTGMIMAFEQVARTQGSAGAAELAEGIYQALVTTVVGLIIAIPSLGAFAILRNRVDEMAAEAAYQAQHALGPLKHASRYGGGPPPAPPK